MCQSDRRRRNLARAKALMLVIIIIASLVVVRFTPVRNQFTIKQLEFFCKKQVFGHPWPT